VIEILRDRYVIFCYHLFKTFCTGFYH